MKFHALLNLYNDRTFLTACLESLVGNVDSVIVADGAYQLYYDEIRKTDPDVKPYSTDGTLEILKDFHGLPNLTVLPAPDKPWTNQCEKRTTLIEAVSIGDWFVIIDGDEMLHGDVEEGLEEIYESGCSVAHVPLYNVGLDVERLHPRWHPRIYEKTEGMHYRGTHWHLRDKYKKIIEERYPVFWTDRFVLVHFKALKRLEKLIPHQEYMRLMQGFGWMETKHDE